MALALAERSKELICNWKPNYHAAPTHRLQPGNMPQRSMGHRKDKRERCAQRFQSVMPLTLPWATAFSN